MFCGCKAGPGDPGYGTLRGGGGSEPLTAEATQVSEPHKVGLKIGLNFKISIREYINNVILIVESDKLCKPDGFPLRCKHRRIP